MPEGAKVSERCELPSFFTFVLTGGDGARMYGSCLMFYETLTENELKKVTETIQEMKKSIESRKQLQTCQDVSDNEEEEDLDGQSDSKTTSEKNEQNQEIKPTNNGNQQNESNNASQNSSQQLTNSSSNNQSSMMRLLELI